MKAPQPGVHKGVSESDYHAWDAISASLLKELRRKPPAWFKHRRLHPPAETDAQRFGSIVHAAILEPETFESRVAIAPSVRRQGVANLELWAQFEAEAVGKFRMSQAEYDKARGMRDAAREHPVVDALLKGAGINEGSAVWTLHELACKGRFDRLTQQGGHALIVDLKTTQDASRDAFSRAISEYGYHVSAAWYIQGLYELGPINREFVLVAQEKEAPYLCAVYQLMPDALDAGRREVDSLFHLYQDCIHGGTWPGYTPHGAEMISLPPWVTKREQLIEEIAA